MATTAHLKVHNYSSYFLKALQQLDCKESFCDSTLVCNGTYFPVHRLILSSFSEYFKEIFERTPCKHPFVIIMDIEPLILKTILNFIYQGEVKLPHQKLLSFIKVAEALKINGLTLSPEEQISENNAESTAEKILKKYCNNFIQGIGKSLTPGSLRVNEDSDSSVSEQPKDDYDQSGFDSDSSSVNCTDSNVWESDTADKKQNRKLKFLDPIVPLQKLSLDNQFNTAHEMLIKSLKSTRNQTRSFIHSAAITKSDQNQRAKVKKHKRVTNMDSRAPCILDDFRTVNIGRRVQELSSAELLADNEKFEAEEHLSQIKVISVSGGETVQFENQTTEVDNIKIEEHPEVKIESDEDGMIGNIYGNFVSDGLVVDPLEFSNPPINSPEENLHSPKNVMSTVVSPVIVETESVNNTDSSKNITSKTCVEGLTTDNRPRTGENIKCHHCSYNGSSISDIKEHYESNHFLGRMLHRCSVCPYESNTSASMKAHEISHTKKSYKCRYCWYRSCIKFACVRHERRSSCRFVFAPRMHSKRINKPSISDLSAAKYSGIKVETNKDTDKINSAIPVNDAYSNINTSEILTNIRCSEYGCSYTTFDRKIMNMHLVTHKIASGEGSRNVIMKRKFCSFCPYRGPNARLLSIHESLHNNKCAFKCSICFYLALSADKLKKHLYRVHELKVKRTEDCGLCPYKNSNEKTMALHKALHYNENALKCPSCDYLTLVKSYLLCHRRNVHCIKSEGRKKIQCRLCPYRNWNQKTIIFHEALHRDENVLKCSMCFFLANNENSIIRHLVKVHKEISSNNEKND